MEVISGGAAAVYGADAISGVVNLITKKNFEGAQFDATYGITQEGDGQEYQLSALFGTNYANSRGNVMFGASYSDRGEIRGKDRSWVRSGWEDPGTMSGGTVPGASNTERLQLRQPVLGPGLGVSAEHRAVMYVIDQSGHLFDPTSPLNPAHPVYRADQLGVGVQDQSERPARLLRQGREQHLRAARTLTRCLPRRPSTSMST